jgi:hypothetical protein
MKRREFIFGVAVAALASRVHAQQSSVIGLLNGTNRDGRCGGRGDPKSCRISLSSGATAPPGP